MTKEDKTIIVICICLLLIAVLMLIAYIIQPTKSAASPTTETTTIEPTTETTTTTTTSKKQTTTKRTQTTTRSTTQATGTKAEYQEYAKGYMEEVYEWGEEDFNALVNLWNRESGWNANAYNRSSGACGIPQALPCSKITNSEGSNDWKAQIRWGLKYIKNRYGSPSAAWEHFKKKGWY